MIFCSLVLEDGNPVGKKCISVAPPVGYTIPYQGIEYVVLRGGFLDPPPDEQIKRYVIDEAILTVKPVK